MESFLNLLQNFSFDDEDIEHHFLSNGSTPDAVCAALALRLGDLDTQSDDFLPDNPNARRVARLALTRLIEMLAENASVTEAEMEDLFASVIGLGQGTSAVTTWKYPIVNVAPGSGGFDNGEFKQFSALKMFGYTVGKKGGWPTQKRTQFLTDFMTCELPPDVERVFGDEYGAPMTAQRLRKIANVIASNCGNFIRNDEMRYRVAISQWKADLKFLKEEFYQQQGLQFDPWPTPG